MKTLAIMFFGIALLWIGWIFMHRPIRHRVQVGGLSRYLDDLLRAYGEGSVLIARHRPTGRFVQFGKYVCEGESRLNLGFPDARWSREYFPRVKARLSELGLQPIIRETSTSECARFVDIDSISSEAEAAMIAKEVLEVMGVMPDDELVVTIKGELDPGFVKGFVEKGKVTRAED